MEKQEEPDHQGAAISVKERIKFFQNLAKNKQDQRKSQPTRNIFLPKRDKTKSPFADRKSEDEEKPRRATEIKRESKGDVGSLINFFSQKIQEKEDEKQRRSQLGKKGNKSPSSLRYDISEYNKYDTTSSSYTGDGSFASRAKMSQDKSMASPSSFVQNTNPFYSPQYQKYDHTNSSIGVYATPAAAGNDSQEFSASERYPSFGGGVVGGGITQSEPRGRSTFETARSPEQPKLPSAERKIYMGVMDTMLFDGKTQSLASEMPRALSLQKSSVLEEGDSQDVGALRKMIEELAQEVLHDQKESFVLLTQVEAHINKMMGKVMREEVNSIVLDCLVERQHAASEARANAVVLDIEAESLLESAMTQELNNVAKDALFSEQINKNVADYLTREMVGKVIEQEIKAMAQIEAEKESQEVNKQVNYLPLGGEILVDPLAEVRAERHRSSVKLRTRAEEQLDLLIDAEVLAALEDIIDQEKHLDKMAKQIANKVENSVLENLTPQVFKSAAGEFRSSESLLHSTVYTELERLVFETWLEEQRRVGSSKSIPRRSQTQSTYSERNKLSPIGIQEDDQFLTLEDQEIIPQGGELGGGQEDIQPHSDDDIQDIEIHRVRTVKFVNYIRVHNSLPLGAGFVDVLCVNCYECVKVSEVDEHSLRCQKPAAPENSATLLDLNNRMFKLNKSIDARLVELRKAKQFDNEKLDWRALDDYECTLVGLAEIGNDVFIKNSSEVMLQIQATRLHALIASLNLDMAYYPSLKVFAERLAQLLDLKIQLIAKIRKDYNNQEHQTLTNPFMKQVFIKSSELVIEEEIKEIDKNIEAEQLNLVHVKVLKNKILNDFMRKSLDRRRANLSELNSDLGRHTRVQSVHSLGSFEEQIFG